MDTENVAPLGAPVSQRNKRGRGLSARSLQGDVIQGKSALGVRSGSAKQIESSAPTRRRALGDITNSDALRANTTGRGNGAKDGKAKVDFSETKSRDGRAPGLRKARAKTRPLVTFDRAIPLDENGNIADIEPIPAGAALYQPPPYEPNLREELGLDDVGEEDPEAEHYMDDFPSVLVKEDMPLMPETDIWEGLEVMDSVSEEEVWRACDGDMGIFCIELPALSLADDDEDAS